MSIPRLEGLMPTKRCEWCKKRRVCVVLQVLMRGPAIGLGKRLVFCRIWQLCSQCRESCEARLHTAYRDVPE